MESVFEGRTVGVRANGVQSLMVREGKPGLPEYVRLTLESFPLNVNTMMTPDAARRLAREIEKAADEADTMVSA